MTSTVTYVAARRTNARQRPDLEFPRLTLCSTCQNDGTGETVNTLDNRPSALAAATAVVALALAGCGGSDSEMRESAAPTTETSHVTTSAEPVATQPSTTLAAAPTTSAPTTTNPPASTIVTPATTVTTTLPAGPEPVTEEAVIAAVNDYYRIRNECAAAPDSCDMDTVATRAAGPVLTAFERTFQEFARIDQYSFLRPTYGPVSLDIDTNEASVDVCVLAGTVPPDQEWTVTEVTDIVGWELQLIGGRWLLVRPRIERDYPRVVEC